MINPLPGLCKSGPGTLQVLESLEIKKYLLRVCSLLM
jgi:hypothetical protein